MRLIDAGEPERSEAGWSSGACAKQTEAVDQTGAAAPSRYFGDTLASGADRSEHCSTTFKFEVPRGIASVETRSLY